MIKKFLLKIISPVHLWKAFTVSRSRKRVDRSVEDPQLKLYDTILKTDFLHYGYFENSQKEAAEISFNDIRRAQVKYAELILQQVPSDAEAVLDVGCGMGGLIGMLLKKKLNVTGITPDRVQIDYIANKYPQATLIKSKFQKMSAESFGNTFDVVIHSESLQYMGLEKAITKVKTILKKKGRWVVVDYFRTAEAVEHSGHYWDNFQQKLKYNGLKIIYSQDITENIRPTLDYIYMWGNEIGKPVFDFLAGKLAKKHPAKYYLLTDVLNSLADKMDKNLQTVNPDIFIKNKKYILLSIERDTDQNI